MSQSCDANILKGGTKMNESINEKVEIKTIPTKEKVTYLYNVLQINYYLSHGICPKQIGINSTTKRVWAMFGWDQTTEIFGKWCQRKVVR